MSSTLDIFFDVLVSIRSELFMFVFAILLHSLLFGGFAQKKKSKNVQNDAFSPPAPNAKGCLLGDVQVLDEFQECRGRGDHRGVCRLWNKHKNGRLHLEPSCLANVIESMQRVKVDARILSNDVKVYLGKNGKLCGNFLYLNELLADLAKSLDIDLITSIVEFYKASFDLAPDAKTYEIILQVHFGTRSYSQISQLDSEMKKQNIHPTSRSSFVLLRTALQLRSFDNAMRHYKALRVSSNGGNSPPAYVEVQIVELAIRDHQLDKVLEELEAGCMHCTTEIVNTILNHAGVAQNHSARVLAVAAKQSLQSNSVTYQARVRLAGGDREALIAILDEVIADRRDDCLRDVAPAILGALDPARDIEIVDKLCSHVCNNLESHLPMFAAMVCFYSMAGESGKACELYLKHLRSRHGTEFQRCLIDANTQKYVIQSALSCGKHDVVADILRASPSARIRHVAKMKKPLCQRDLDDAFAVIEILGNEKDEITESMWNAALEGCGELGELDRANELMQKITKLHAASVQTYNALLKGHLKKGAYANARKIIGVMREAGFPPNHLTYNDFLNSMVSGEVSRQEVWDAVDEMVKHGLSPNRVTFSILLKTLQESSSQADIERTVSILDTMDEAVDEVLLSSLAETYTRIGKPRCLMQKLNELQQRTVNGRHITVTGSHTYGSLIKACGHAKDLNGVWRHWKEMRSRNVKLTDITIGCMVEAVASNGDADEALKLVRQLHQDPSTKDQINAVQFGSLIKAYARSGSMEAVWTTFQEMITRNVQPSPMTYNALFDACARSRCMERVPALLEDMEQRSCQPNLITFSTIIKGYVHAGKMDIAFEFLKRLHAAKLKPDVITYNTILEGCVKQRAVDSVLQVLSDMESVGVHPNNFTLTLIGRALGSANKLDLAFQTIESLVSCGKYRLRVDAHVGSALIDAAVMSQEPLRAVPILERMMRERYAPQQATLESLLHALGASGNVSTLAGLLQKIFNSHVGNVGDVLLAQLFSDMAAQNCQAAQIAFRLHAELASQGILPGPKSRNWSARGSQPSPSAGWAPGSKSRCYSNREWQPRMHSRHH